MLTLEDMVAIVKPHNDKLVAEHKLDLAWEKVKALIAARCVNDYEAGYKAAARDILRILEELGGSDPIKKAREELARLRFEPQP
jgi:hypothetical protein